MNVTTNNAKNQSKEKRIEKTTRAEIRGKKKTDEKQEKSKKKKTITGTVPKTQNPELLLQHADEIMKNLKAHTWRDLETAGKFSKNDKLSFIRDDMLIVGCDIGSETHYVRAIDTFGQSWKRL